MDLAGTRLLAAVAPVPSDLAHNLRYLLIMALVAALVPLVVGLLQLRIAEVVLLLVAGVILGPQVLGWVELTNTVNTFAELGLGLLFFLAGYELDQAAIVGRSGRLAGIGWVSSVVLSLVIVLGLWKVGVVHDVAGVAIALTSTALGTLLPVIRDSGRLHTPFGTYFMGAGAAGEFGPILAISLVLGSKDHLFAIGALVVFGLIALAVAWGPMRLATARVQQLFERGHHTSAQTAVRWTVVLLLALLVLASQFGLDAVLGAFVAGVILKRYSPDHADNQLTHKIEALGFGFFIPMFFVVTGVTLDVRSIAANPARLVLFLVLLLVVRGLPQLLVYRRAIPALAERVQFTFYVATALPILVAIATVEQAEGVMRPENAAALIGAGALSVLLFPLTGDLVNRRGMATVEAAPGPAPEGPADDLQDRRSADEPEDGRLEPT